jgi:hypothetical protein
VHIAIFGAARKLLKTKGKCTLCTLRAVSQSRNFTAVFLILFKVDSVFSSCYYASFKQQPPVGKPTGGFLFGGKTMKFTMFFGSVSLIAIPLPTLSGITLSVIALLTASGAEGSKPAFQGKSVTRSAIIHLHGPIVKVFPLFEPIGETAWAPGWEPQVVYPPSRDARNGTVFLTYDEHRKNETYWTIIEYDAQRHRITYINVIPNYQVRRITVECRETAADQTDATVSYSYTGTTPHGNDDVVKQTEDSYAAKMQHWTLAINHYLETGKKIEMH